MLVQQVAWFDAFFWGHIYCTICINSALWSNKKIRSVAAYLCSLLLGVLSSPASNSLVSEHFCLEEPVRCVSLNTVCQTWIWKPCRNWRSKLHSSTKLHNSTTSLQWRKLPNLGYQDDCSSTGSWCLGSNRGRLWNFSTWSQSNCGTDEKP